MEKDIIEFNSKLSKADLKYIYKHYAHLDKTDNLLMSVALLTIMLVLYWYYSKINLESILPFSIGSILLILMKIGAFKLFDKRFNDIKKFKIHKSLMYVNDIELSNYKDLIITQEFLFFKNPTKAKIIKIPSELKNDFKNLLNEQSIPFRVIDVPFPLTAYKSNKI